MNVNKVTIFLGIFVFMAVFYYFYEHKGGEVRKEREELGKKALVFSPDSLESFRIMALKENSSAVDTVSLAREQGRWRLVSPIESNVDSQAVAGLLSSAASATMDRVVEDSAADLSIFGLKNPGFVLEVFPRGTNSSLRLSLGSKNPTGSYIYAANSESPERVILLNNWLLPDLKKTPRELRDKKVFHFDKELVSKLVIETAGTETLRLERELGEWYLRSPLAAPADRDSVRGILAELEGTEAESFIDEVNLIDSKRFGLNKPLITVRLYQENEQAVHLLDIGTKQGVDGPYYARREGGENVCLVEADLVERLTANASRLQDRSLMRDPKDSVVNLRMETPEYIFTAKKSSEEGEWSLVSGSDSARADNQAVEDLLRDLKNIEAESFIKKPGPALLRTLENPFLRLEYRTGDSASAPVALEFAAHTKQDSLAWVRVRGAREQVALVDAEKARGLVKSFHDLRNKKIIEFDTGEIIRIGIESGGETFSLEKEDDKWLLASPEQTETREWKVQNLLWDLSGMEFTGIVDSETASGLESPLLEITLWGEGKEPFFKAAFGDSIPGGNEIFLQVTSDERVFTVEKSVFDGLPGSAADVKKEEE
jgi:Domain of unknown function (DUF4340)